jgi:hypothetical protein
MTMTVPKKVASAALCHGVIFYITVTEHSLFGLCHVRGMSRSIYHDRDSLLVLLFGCSEPESVFDCQLLLGDQFAFQTM